MPGFSSTHIVSAQRSIKSMERLLEMIAIPNAKTTMGSSVGVPGETLSMQLKCLLSFKLYITLNLHLYVAQRST